MGDNHKAKLKSAEDREKKALDKLSDANKAHAKLQISHKEITSKHKLAKEDVKAKEAKAELAMEKEKIANAKAKEEREARQELEKLRAKDKAALKEMKEAQEEAERKRKK